MAMGVYVDPSYAFPLPIFGVNYLDFEFGTPDSQLAMLWDGSCDGPRRSPLLHHDGAAPLPNGAESGGLQNLAGLAPGGDA